MHDNIFKSESTACLRGWRVQWCENDFNKLSV